MSQLLSVAQYDKPVFIDTTHPLMLLNSPHLPHLLMWSAGLYATQRPPLTKPLVGRGHPSDPFGIPVGFLTRVLRLVGCRVVRVVFM